MQKVSLFKIFLNSNTTPFQQLVGSTQLDSVCTTAVIFVEERV